MPWNEVSVVDSRRLFVHACESSRSSFAAVCREYGISRQTGYTWVGRWRAEGEAGLLDRSRRPHRIASGTAVETEEALVALRRRYPAWGVRKLCRLLEQQGVSPPPERTSNRILQRHGLVSERPSTEDCSHRFERVQPNMLWQVDHKRAIHGSWAARTVPLVVEDDASRYLIALQAQPDKGLTATWGTMWDAFGEFGLPDGILTDNDAIFHGRIGPSRFEVMLLRLGIKPLHGRPYHPQTQGKVERLHGTLERELLRDGHFRSADELQAGFDAFRTRYNYDRPHEALGLEVPATRYRPSSRRRPAKVPQVEYPPSATLRTGTKDGWISWRGRRINVGLALRGEKVEVRETDDGIDVYYGSHRLLGTTLAECRAVRG